MDFKRNDLVILYQAKPLSRHMTSRVACIHDIEADGTITVLNGMRFAPDAYRKPTFDELQELYIDIRSAYERVCDELYEDVAA